MGSVRQPYAFGVGTPAGSMATRAWGNHVHSALETYWIKEILCSALYSPRSPKSETTLLYKSPILCRHHRDGTSRLRSVVLGPDEIDKSLRLLVAVVAVAVAVVVVLGADVLHLVDGAALGATLDGASARHLIRGYKLSAWLSWVELCAFGWIGTCAWEI